MTWDSYSLILRRQGSESTHRAETVGETGQGRKDGAQGGSQAHLGSHLDTAERNAPAPYSGTPPLASPLAVHYRKTGLERGLVGGDPLLPHPSQEALENSALGLCPLPLHTLLHKPLQAVPKPCRIYQCRN